MVSDVSVHGYLALPGSGEAEHHGREHVVEQAAHLLVSRRQKERQEGAGLQHLL
jgi:hypothetical protein